MGIAVGSSQWGGAGHYPVLTDREAEAAAARHKSDWLTQEAANCAPLLHYLTSTVQTNVYP